MNQQIEIVTIIFPTLLMNLSEWFLLELKDSSIQVIKVCITNIGGINSIISLTLIQLWSVKTEIVMQASGILRYILK